MVKRHNGRWLSLVASLRPYVAACFSCCCQTLQHPLPNWSAGKKKQSITQLNVSNGWYILDQHSNYMFRPLEAIFSLHKIELEERDIIHIGCAMAYQWWDLTIDTPLRALYVLYPSLPALFRVSWRWPLVAETCSYYVELIHTNH